MTARISGSLIESLKTLGLTEYEAKVYAALVLFDRAEAKQIYEYLEVPKPSVYQSLKALTDKGLVQMVSARPALYRATPPKVALRHMTEVHRKAEDIAILELEELEKAQGMKDYPNVLWTLYGAENVEHKLEEMLEGASVSAKAIIPAKYIVYLGLLAGRGIQADIMAFGPENVAAVKEVLPEARVHDARTIDFTGLEPLLAKFERMPIPPEQLQYALGVLADDAEMMYIPPIPATEMSGFTSRNPMVVALMDIVFSILWERTI
jgi:sugar-specific transcriptional regulator TrmB